LAEGLAAGRIVGGRGVGSPPVALFDLDELGLLSQCREGPASFRPFDARRDGFIAGDGAAALVLEPLERARARTARVRGCIRGLASFTDGGARRSPAGSAGTGPPW